MAIDYVYDRELSPESNAIRLAQARLDELRRTTNETATATRESMEKASLELDKALAIIDLAEGNAALDQAGEFDAIFAVIGDLVRKGKEVLDHATSEALRAEARTQVDAWRHSCSVENGGARA